MDETNEHKVFIKCLLTLFFNRFSKNYTLRLIVFKSLEIFSLKIIPLGISQTDLKIIMFIEFMYCMKFCLFSFCISYINKEYTVGQLNRQIFYQPPTLTFDIFAASWPTRMHSTSFERSDSYLFGAWSPRLWYDF